MTGHPDDSPEVGQEYVVPPTPPGTNWPRPSETAYPMKPWDRLLDDGRLYSDALERVKENQHETRVVLHWDERQWVPVRRRLRNQTTGNDQLAAWREFVQSSGSPALRGVSSACVSPSRAARAAIPVSTDEYAIGETPPTSQVEIGDPGEVVISLLPSGELEIAEFAVRWHGHEPLAYRLDGQLLQLTTSDASVSADQISDLIRQTRRRRRRRYRRCVRCQTMTPPEWWNGQGYCQSCAERYLGVVY